MTRPESACHGDCIQGRECDCRPTSCEGCPGDCATCPVRHVCPDGLSWKAAQEARDGAGAALCLVLLVVVAWALMWGALV